MRESAKPVERFGRYRVTGTLGSGAMGEVFAAVDDSLGREVAVKTLRAGSSGLAARMLDERFRLEARAIARLSHPSVVQVFDLDLSADPPYLVMERVTGPSLRERVRAGALSERELRALGIQIARALAAAHAAGVVHRDVKPANILAAGDGVWKLADFGVAHVPDSSLTFTGQFVGSPAYAPPEALLRGQCDACGDVFGLAASLYEAAAQRWPRADATTGGLLAPVPPLATLAPHLAPALAAAIDRALSIEPAERPSAADLADALALAPTPSGQIYVPTPTPAPAVHSPSMLGAGTDPGYAATHAAPSTLSSPSAAGAPSRRRWVIAGAAIALVILLAAALSTRSGDAPATNAVTPTAPREPDPPPATAPRPPPPPDRITVTPPPLRDRRAAKDWNKVRDHLERRHFSEARKKLGDFERKWGESPETQHLREQLDALPADGPPRGPPRHEHEHKHEHDED
ncbi:MAG: serine/threonine protein kinase [Deltaproteobacteria bacterium]|nr:serine/threonine protein kinase [Deltaproteobacteria bacterium]